MSNDFKGAGAAAVGTGWITVYTAPSLKTSAVVSLTLCNLLNTGITADVQFVDSSASGQYYLVKTVPINVGSTLQAVSAGQKIFLEAGDSIRVKASQATAIDVVVAYLEDIQ